MKHYPVFILLALLFIASCQKHDTNIVEKNYLENVKSALKDSFSNSEFESLDFSKTVLSKVDSIQLYLLRIPYKDKPISNEFVIVKTTRRGDLQQGRIVHLQGQITESGKSIVKKRQWNGHLSVKMLNGTNVRTSSITNGFAESFHKPNQKEPAISDPYPDPYILLPEVIVISNYPSGGGISYSTWVSLTSFFNYNSGGGGNFYGNINPTNGGGGGGGGSTGKDPILTEDPIQIDFENQYSDPAIEVEKYMKCFSTVSDVGAKCSIEIFADIPVDGDPDKFFDWDAGSPGHTFIQIKKENGSQSISQNIGFYPKSRWSSILTTAPLNAKFVDNQQHEFNASYKINITASQLQTAITRILYLSRFVRYDIDDYNCTDWALDVFNQTVRPEEYLNIPRYDIPGGMAPNGTSTPQGLYIKLQEMKKAGGIPARNITIPIVGWVGTSKGACN
jgi:hypothetical protein